MDCDFTSWLIASLTVGDHVLAYDPTTGAETTQTITHVYLNHDNNRLDVTLALPATTATASPAIHSLTASQPTRDAEIARERARAVAGHGLRAPPNSTTTSATTTAEATEVLHTTANHPWLTADRGWQLAGDLHVGEAVRLLDGGTARVVGLRALASVGTMWDLSLDATHTFAVGGVQAVVHNQGDAGPRYTPGVVTGGDQFPSVQDHPAEFFVQEGGARIIIPREVAQGLRGRTFSTFDDFRVAFWEQMGATPQVAGRFSQANQLLMLGTPDRDPQAPFAPSNLGYEGRGRYELNHITPLSEGGATYDLNNLEVLAPRTHVAYHQNYQGGGQVLTFL